jgi:uncharacterized protein YecT (DUF1311 family)
MLLWSDGKRRELFQIVLIRLGIILQNRRLRWGKLFIIIVLLGLFSTQAIAASFDCNKAASWLEKTVCSNPELSKLDEELAKAYHDALASLSPEGQKETKQYQRQWLKELSSCQSVGCLKDVYKERIKQLQHSLIKFPDRIFRNVQVMYGETDEGCPDYIAGKGLSYPQVENPRNENDKFWNTLISQKAHSELKIDDGCTDTAVEYTAIFTNKYIISLLTGRSSAPHGSGRSFQFTTSVCWLLEGKRELQTSDLFDDKTGWRTKLVASVSPKLKEQEVADEETYEIEPSRLMEIVTSSDHWVILKGGLGIQFRQYELGSRAIPFITIDWKALDPYLSKNGHSLIHD